MKKNFKSYAVIWLILFAVFNAVVFIVRSAVLEYLSFDASFWIAWSIIIVAFSGNLVCAYFAFKAENTKKMFYKLPLITLSCSALIAMLVVGCVLMLIPKCPAWIASVICILVFAFNVITVVKAKWAGDTVSSIDEKIKAQTALIKSITVDAQILIGHAKNDTAKAECKNVYEALRYSDPITNQDLSSIENNISVKMSEFTLAVDEDDTEKVTAIAKEIVTLVKERNNKCQKLK